MRALLLLSLVLYSFNGLADEVSPQLAPAEIPPSSSYGFRPFLGLGSALIFENSNGGTNRTSALPLLISLGTRFNWEEQLVEPGTLPSTFWSANLEYSAVDARDGNSTVSTFRKRESLLVWLSRDFGQAKGWVPYFALAAGASQRRVETRIGASNESTTGEWLSTGAAAAGFRARWSRLVTTKCEYRYELGDSASFSEKTKDARSGVGFIVEVSL